MRNASAARRRSSTFRPFTIINWRFTTWSALRGSNNCRRDRMGVRGRMENDKEMTEAKSSRSAKASNLRMKLLLSLSLAVVFCAGLLLGRFRLSGSENGGTQNASESKPASEAKEWKAPANQ